MAKALQGMANREAVGGFILAGGRSSRMGRAKGLLMFAGEPLVVHVARLLELTCVAPVIVGPPGAYATLGFRVVPDDGENFGPLGGIATALRIATREWNLIVGCDLPFLTREWIEFLISRAIDSRADVVIPLNERGFEPLCAMYRKGARPAIVSALDCGVRKITDGLAGLSLTTLAPAEWKAFDPEGRLFKNVNTPEDYDEARQSLREETKS